MIHKGKKINYKMAVFVIVLTVCAVISMSLLMPGVAEAKPSNGSQCLGCHVGIDGDSTLDAEIWDGTGSQLLNTVSKDATAGITRSQGEQINIDWRCTNTTRAANNDGAGIYISVPTGWTVGPGDITPTIAGWNTNWDNSVGTGTWQSPLAGSDYAGNDGYSIDFQAASSPYSIGNSGSMCDEGGSGCTDPDGIADNLGGDAKVTVGASSGSIIIHCIGHMEGGGGKGTKSYTRAQIDVTVGGGATTTVGDGSLPGNKYAGPSDADVGVSTFTLSTDSGTDTVTAIDVTGNAGSASNLTSVSIYDDSTGTTPNEWDASDIFR